MYEQLSLFIDELEEQSKELAETVEKIENAKKTLWRAGIGLTKSDMVRISKYVFDDAIRKFSEQREKAKILRNDLLANGEKSTLFIRKFTDLHDCIIKFFEFYGIKPTEIAQGKSLERGIKWEIKYDCLNEKMVGIIISDLGVKNNES